MCGRFTLRTPLSVVVEHFDLDARGVRQLPLFEPRYNIAPTQKVLVVRSAREGHGRGAAMLRWGLVPSWAREIASSRPMINARAESLAEKPAFRSAYRRQRCLIPADGFYEWKQLDGAGSRARKQPYHIHRPDGGLFAFAGLWETWLGPSAAGSQSRKPRSGGPPLESCTLVTTEANRALRELHDRMPVILDPGNYGLWLDTAVEDPAALAHLLAPCGDDELVAEPVAAEFLSGKVDGPAQTRLF